MDQQIIRAAPGSALARQVPGPRQKWFRLATEAVDGHGTRFLMAGCDLSQHRANPVLLWGHGSGRNAIGDPPDPRNVVGRVAEYDLTRDHLDILCEFDTEEFADLVWRKVDAGLIRACSLGAIAVDPPEEVDGVPTFRRWRLTEASIVIVGSNRESLALDRDASVAALGEMRVPIAEAATPADSAAMSAALAGTVMGKSQRRRLPEQVASVAVFRADGSMLFGKRRDNGRWTTPGGHLNPGESPEAGARRELREEAGIEADVERLGHGRVGDYTIHCYRADVADEEPDASGDPDEEVGEWRWYQKDAYLRERPPLHAARNVLLRLIGWGPGDGIEVLDEVARPPSLSAQVPPGPVGLSPAQDEPPAERDLYDTVPVDEPARAARGVVRVVRGAVVHEHEPPTVDVVWDADAAVRRVARWASSDGSGDPDKVDWAKYRLAFAWFDDEHPALGAGKLPHHDVRGGRLVTVWRGVVAAAAALSGARGGVDLPADAVPAVRAHLAAHYREFDKLPPWESGGDHGAELARARESRYRGIDFRLAPGVASALRDGLRWRDEGYGGGGLVQDTVRDARRLVSEGAWWPAKARAARGWFARHGAQAGALEAPADASAPRTGRRRPTPKGVAWALWGGDAGKRQVERLVREMDEADQAAERDALAALAPDADPALLQRDLDSYLPRSVAAHGAAPDSMLTNKVAAPPPREKTMPKLEAQHYGMLRALIGAKCDMAEMHARAHDDVPADMAGLRGAHRDMAGHALRQAEELHGLMREAHGKHFEPDGDEGSVRGVPAFLKDEDMKRDFGTVYAALGRVSPTLGQVIREELGDDEPEKVRARVAAMKDDAEQLASVQEKQAAERAAGAMARAESLIEEHLRSGRITPARALEMRGHDARAYQPGAQPTKPRWSESRIQEYLAQRQQPAVEVTRAAPLHVVEAPAGAAAPLPGTPLTPAALPQHRPSMVRVGAAQAPATVDLRLAAQEMATKLASNGIPGAQQRDGVTADSIAEVAAAMQRGEIVIPRPSASGLQSIGGADASMVNG